MSLIIFSSSDLGFSIIICYENFFKKRKVLYFVKKEFENVAFKIIGRFLINAKIL